MKQSTKSIRILLGVLSFCYGVFVWSLVIFAALISFEVWSGVQSSRFEGNSFVVRADRYVSVNPQMPAISFPVRKDENVFRVFILGSSQAMGWPYVQNQSHFLPSILGLENKGGIGTWLELYLQGLMPDKCVEVHNVTMDMGSPMRRTVEVYREVAAIARPDLCIILEGNNEDWEISRLDSDFDGHDFSPEAMELVSVEFKKHIAQILAVSSEHSLETFLLTVPNNIRNYKPEDPIPPELEEMFRSVEDKKYAQIIDDLLAFPGARDSAPVLFYTGLCYDRIMDYDNARKYYLAAKDRSGLCQMHRCRSRWNNIIRSFKGRGKFLHIFDFEKYLFQNSKDGIPGYDLFLSGCHMNLKGNKLAALGVAEFFCAVNNVSDKDRGILESVRLPELDSAKLILNYRLQKAKLVRQKFVLSLFRSKYGLSRLLYGNNIKGNIENLNRMIAQLQQDRK